MATTDKEQWVLLDTDLTTQLSILPVISSHFYGELNEPGSGSIVIPLQSNAASIISSGQFCQCTYRGTIQGGFFVDNIQEKDASSGEAKDRTVTVNGRGALALLEDAIVWNDGTSTTYRDFSGYTKAGILITLIDEAQARGALANMTYDFTFFQDSASVSWSDDEYYRFNVGTNLLEVLRSFTRIGAFDAEMNLSGGSFVLSAYLNGIGTDKTDTIFLRIGSNCEDVSSDERGDDIHNVLLAKYKDGYALVSNPTSITNRRRREQLLNIEIAQSSDSAQTYASSVLDTLKDPLKSIAVKVYDGRAPHFSLDYILGDYVTVERMGVETTYRILGIQADFDGVAYSHIVVELNNIIYENGLRIQADLDWLLNQWNTAKDDNLTEVKQWLSMGNPNGEVYAIHRYGSYLYVGGDFTAITGRATTSYIARYNLDTGQWSAMANTLTSKVVAITNISSTIYAATDTKVYSWDGSAWTQIGVIDNTATGHILFMYPNGSDLYVGGLSITGINTVNMSEQLGRYDGSWHAVNGSMPTSSCSRIVFYNGVLHAAFSVGLMKLVGGVWSFVFASIFDSPSDVVVAGSSLSFIMLEISSFKAYIWDGVAASPTLIGTLSGGGPGGTNYHMFSYLSDIYIANVSTVSVTGTTTYNYVARYSGGNWTALDSGVWKSSSFQVRAILAIDDDVYVGGGFTHAGVDAQGARVSNPYLALWVTSFQSLVTHLSKDSSFDLPGAVHGAPVASVTDNDEFYFWEDTSQDGRKITWTNIKSTLKTYFDTLYAAIADLIASNISITDAGGYYTSTDVEGALQEIAGGGGGSDMKTQILAAPEIPEVDIDPLDTYPLLSYNNSNDLYQIGFATLAVAIHDNLILNKIIAATTGWLEVDAPTRTGNHTFTIGSDVTNIYRKGTKVRYKDGGSYEYGVVGSSSWSSPTCTVNLIPNTDYAMAAGTLTDVAISYIENPEGFPHYFTYGVTWTSTPTPNPAIGDGTLEGYWCVRGRSIIAKVRVICGSTTTFGTGYYNFSLPINTTRVTSSLAMEAAAGHIYDSSSGLRYACAAYVRSSDMRLIYANGIVSYIAPYTFAASDQLYCCLEYEF